MLFPRRGRRNIIFLPPHSSTPHQFLHTIFFRRLLRLRHSPPYAKQSAWHTPTLANRFVVCVWSRKMWLLSAANWRYLLFCPSSAGTRIFERSYFCARSSSFLQTRKAASISAGKAFRHLIRRVRQTTMWLTSRL